MAENAAVQTGGTSAPPILEMRSITKEFPGVRALSEVSLTVHAGEIHAICGENGAGKSTLMKVLSGVYPYGTYEGDIVYQGEVCRFKDIRSSETAGIVIIHQELALIPELSITENIFLGNEPREVRRDQLVRGEAPHDRPAGPGGAVATTRTPRSSRSASASSSWSRSPRRSTSR